MQFIIDLMLLSLYAFFTIAVFAYIRRFWLMYVGQKFLIKLQEDTIMLEIKLPREIDKSPLAMEMVLSNFIQTSGLSWYNKGIAGAIPTTFSLEIASLEGVVHFYIRTHKKFQELLKSALYAHYPGVEVVKVDDYTSKFPRYEHHKGDHSTWGNGFKLTQEFSVQKIKKDPEKLKKEQPFLDKVFLDKIDEDQYDEKKMPGDVIPIRTYVDLKLDKEKEEFKVDPLVSILEFLGSLGKGEYAGYQILIQSESVYDNKKMPALFQNPIDNKHINMKALASLYKDVIRKKTVIKKGTVVKDEYGKPKERKVTIDGEEKTEIITYAEDITKIDNETSLTFESKNQIELVERKMSKPLFACVLRVIYATDNKRTKFNPDYIQNCLNLLKPFNASSFNTFGFNMSDFANPYDYDWQNPVAKGGAGNIFSNFRAEEVFDAYIEREGFHPHMGTVGWFSSPDADRFFFRWPSYIRRIVTMSAEAILDPFGHPHPSGVFVLNSEELATIYHLPGLVASVPTLPRIDSRKAVAPVNLPV